MNRRALQLLQKSQPAGDEWINAAINRLGVNLYALERYADAEPLFQEAVRMAETMMLPDDPQIPLRYINLATTQIALGKYKEAETRLRSAIKVLGWGNPVDEKKLAEAQKHLEEAVAKQAAVPAAKAAER